ncbi:unnamed protein product, partial [Anisakis simplex]|uniref:DUF1308 domain-containing protein n=1 Tax=Anisakis simplex TaxID=6269 RepID=A0A0M3KJB0_ANISI
VRRKLRAVRSGVRSDYENFVQFAVVFAVRRKLRALRSGDGNAITPKPSKEFLQIRQAIQASRFNVRSADEACIVVPGFDTLSMRRFRSAKHFQMALEAGDRYEIPRSECSSSSSFRRGFDVVIPFWLPPDLLDVEKMSSRGGAEVVAGLAGKGDLPGQVFTMRESGGVSGERLNGQNEKSRATGRNSGKSKGYRLAVVVSYAPEDVRRELESKLRLEVDGKGSVAREIEIVWLDRCEKVDSAIDSGKVDGSGVGVEDGKRSKRKICEIPADLGRNKGKGKGKLRGVDPMERRGRADGNHHEGSGRILKSTDGSVKNNQFESAEASWSTLDSALRVS